MKGSASSTGKITSPPTPATTPKAPARASLPQSPGSPGEPHSPGLPSDSAQRRRTEERTLKELQKEAPSATSSPKSQLRKPLAASAAGPGAGPSSEASQPPPSALATPKDARDRYHEVKSMPPPLKRKTTFPSAYESATASATATRAAPLSDAGADAAGSRKRVGDEGLPLSPRSTTHGAHAAGPSLHSPSPSAEAVAETGGAAGSATPMQFASRHSMVLAGSPDFRQNGGYDFTPLHLQPSCCVCFNLDTPIRVAGDGAGSAENRASRLLQIVPVALETVSEKPPPPDVDRSERPLPASPASAKRGGFWRSLFNCFGLLTTSRSHSEHDDSPRARSKIPKEKKAKAKKEKGKKVVEVVATNATPAEAASAGGGGSQQVSNAICSAEGRQQMLRVVQVEQRAGAGMDY